jgi:cyclic-di-GMP-binding protein
MPSFDVVSEVNLHEAANAVDQASREVATRFDFKGVDARFEREENLLTLYAEAEFQLKQMQDMLLPKLAKRGIDIKCAKIDPPMIAGNKARQVITLQQGIDQPLAKKIAALIKDSKLKVQTSIQGEKIRVTGKKRDDLQLVIALLRKSDLELPLQFDNFRE